MDPVKYEYELETDERTTLTRPLIRQHTSQVNFASKILPTLDKIDLTDSSVISRLIYDYSVFLELCLENKNKLIVPTLMEDFVWHAHMTSHNVYREDTTKIFGRMLGHKTDTPVDKQRKETITLKEKFLEKKRKEGDGSYSSDYGGCIGIWNPLHPFSPINTMSPFNHYNNHFNYGSHDGKGDYGVCSSSCSSSSCSSSCGSSCSGCGGD